jgi:hypothetical protein
MAWPIIPAGLNMKLHGTLATNLQDAIKSAERLRNHPVYPDTLTYWADVLREARRGRIDIVESERLAIDRLIARLATLLIEHSR